MIVSFIFYVMNFVDFVFDFYSHITSHVSQVFATLHKSLFAKLCTCYSVFFFVWPTKFENTLSFMQNVFNAWEFNRKDWKYQCLENWVQNLCFWKTFHLILMHYFHQIQCFEEFLHKIALIFQKFVFSRISIDWTYFSINQNCD